MTVWIYIIFMFALANVVEAVILTARPRRVQLHGEGATPFLNLVCHLNTSDDVTRIYEIEVGREVKKRAIPLARMTASGVSGVDHWRSHRLNVTGELATELGLSFLNVKLTELTCPDVTSYYCLAYYRTPGKMGILSDKVQEDVKSTGVSLLATTNTTAKNQLTIIVNCTFLYPGTSLYQIRIGTKTPTSETLLVAANETGIYSFKTKMHVSKMGHSFGSNSAVESWAAVALLQDSCNVIYFCKAIFVLRNVTVTDEDSKEIQKSCRSNVSRHKNSVTDAKRPEGRDFHTSTPGLSPADRRKMAVESLLTLLAAQQILVGNRL